MKRCVCGGCSNSNLTENVSAFKFPKDVKVAQKWHRFVRRTRVWNVTVEHAIRSGATICSSHFSESCFDPTQKRRYDEGLATFRLRLLPGSVPSVLPISGKVSTLPSQRVAVSTKRKAERAVVTKKLQTARIREEVRSLAKQHQTKNPKAPHTVSRAPSPSPPKLMCSWDTELIVKPIKQDAETQTKITGSDLEGWFKKGEMSVESGPTMSSSTVCAASAETPLVASSPLHVEIQLETHTTLPSTTDSSPPLLPLEPQLDSPVEDSDSSYSPSSEEESSPEKRPKKLSTPDFIEPDANRKYIVYEASLLKLFDVCHLCRKKASPQIMKMMGTMVVVQQNCDTLKCPGYTWHSQPFVGDYPEGNLLLSAATLFSGSSISKVQNLLQFIGVQSYHTNTFFRHQRLFLHDAIDKVYCDQQEELLLNLAPEVLLGGDARCDSPGHSAKYGSYSLMDLHGNKVIAMEIVQKNEVGSSYHMELEGLKRCKVKLLATASPTKITVVTDRHPQITAWIRDHWRPDEHFFDIWHVSKGLNKKLLVIVKKYPEVGKWKPAITNHLYWCATSSDGNGELALAKWRSLSNHIADIHVHKHPLFPRCAHDALSPRQWLQPGSQQYEELVKVLESRQMEKDVQKLSPFGQTASLEAFHAVVNEFAPKMRHFHYHTMKSRLTLAALHYNENAGRALARKADMSLKWKRSFPRGRGGEPVARATRVEATYAYVDKLMDTVMYLVKNPQLATHLRDLREANAPQPLTTEYPEVDTHEVAEALRSRYPHVYP